MNSLKGPISTGFFLFINYTLIHTVLGLDKFNIKAELWIEAEFGFLHMIVKSCFGSRLVLESDRQNFLSGPILPAYCYQSDTIFYFWLACSTQFAFLVKTK